MIDATFYLKRPKKPLHPYPTRFDADKGARALLDGLCTDGGIAVNDSQFTTLKIRKRWVEGPLVGCQVLIADDIE
jgi:Holliday junction resolvase RusA-like endonuclease